MRTLLLLSPFLVSTAYFFYVNPQIDRGEHGGLEYTVTKCLPIMALSLVSLVAFRRPSVRTVTGVDALDRIISARHPAALAFFLSAIGDWLLATRSDSMRDFAVGMIPFAAAHYLNRKFWVYNNSIGQQPRQRYWLFGGTFLLAHAGFVGFNTMPNVLRHASLFFQVITIPYAFTLAWAILSAMSNWYYDERKNSSVTLVYMLGYLTFMVSDSLVIYDSFGSTAMARSQLYVLITYYLAQVLFFVSFAWHDDEKKKVKGK